MVDSNLHTQFNSYDSLLREFSWNNEDIVTSPSFGLNIGWLAVDRHADSIHAKQTALRFINQTIQTRDISFAELKSLTSRFANVLQKLGVQKGETIFSLLERVPELYITALGTLKHTAIFCPLFSVFGPEPILQRLSRGNVSILVTNSSFYKKKILPILKDTPSLKFILLTDIAAHESEKVLSYSTLMNEAVEEYNIPYTHHDTPALLHFTSGTTGMPKGVVHVHKAVLMYYMTGKYVLDIGAGEVFWCTADPGWVTGTSYGIFSPLINRAINLIDEEEFDAERWFSILEKQKVNVWYTAPTAIRRLMRTNITPKDKFHLEQLKAIYSVGEPLHPNEVEWGQKVFGMPILDNWWQTETGGIMIANFPFMKVKPGSMGKPLPGVTAAIAEVTENSIKELAPGEQGHLVIKKGWPSMFVGYLNEEERYKKCFKGEWYVTGDLAKKDKDGYYWFVGRADDIIKTSGHMVGPFEVESALMQHPAVAEVAVIGKPEPMIGELVKAFLVLKPNQIGNEKLKQDIIAFARKKLGPAVAPKEINFINEIPKTKSGKILRRLLKARELGLPEGDLSTLEKN